jgi:hypothetical protein
MKKLRVLCPQEYEGITMRVTTCTKCSSGWNKETQRCEVPVGCEHLPLVPQNEIPDCPIVATCRHQMQSVGPCVVRARGMVCESALVHAGVPDVWDIPYTFDATTVVSEEELAERQASLMEGA